MAGNGAGEGGIAEAALPKSARAMSFRPLAGKLFDENGQPEPPRGASLATTVPVRNKQHERITGIFEGRETPCSREAQSSTKIGRPAISADTSC